MIKKILTEYKNLTPQPAQDRIWSRIQNDLPTLYGHDLSCPSYMLKLTLVAASLLFIITTANMYYQTRITSSFYTKINSIYEPSNSNYSLNTFFETF